MGALYVPPMGFEQVWTPAFSLDTPGTSSFPTSIADGKYWDFGNGLVMAQVALITSSVTLGTGSGNLRITGLPHTVLAGLRGASPDFAGITKAGYTQFTVTPAAATTYCTISASGSGVAVASVQGSDVATGLRFISVFWYTK